MARKREVLPPTKPLLCDHITQQNKHKNKTGYPFFGLPCINERENIFPLFQISIILARYTSNWRRDCDSAVKTGRPKTRDLRSRDLFQCSSRCSLQVYVWFGII